jgi:hypothetical protein
MFRLARFLSTYAVTSNRPCLSTSTVLVPTCLEDDRGVDRDRLRVRERLLADLDLEVVVPVCLLHECVLAGRLEVEQAAEQPAVERE